MEYDVSDTNKKVITGLLNHLKPEEARDYIISLYKQLGYKELSSNNIDVEIILEKNNEITFVRCNFDKDVKITQNDVLDFQRVFFKENVSKNIYISYGGFTTDGIEMALAYNLELFNIDDFASSMSNVDASNNYMRNYNEGVSSYNSDEVSSQKKKPNGCLAISIFLILLFFFAALNSEEAENNQTQKTQSTTYQTEDYNQQNDNTQINTTGEDETISPPYETDDYNQQNINSQKKSINDQSLIISNGCKKLEANKEQTLNKLKSHNYDTNIVMDSYLKNSTRIIDSINESLERGFLQTPSSNIMYLIDSNNLYLGNAEGMNYLKLDILKATSTMKNYLSIDWIKYLQLLDYNLKHPVFDDAAIMIGWDGLRKRIIKFSDFTNKYPNFSNNNSIKTDINNLMDCYLTGTENSPITEWESKQVRKEVIKSYENFIKYNKSSNYYSLVENYYNLLKENNFKLTSEAENYVNSEMQLKN